MEKPNLSALRKELEKLYADFQSDLPVGNSPQEVQELRSRGAHIAASMLTLALYKRSLEEYIRKKEAEIILSHNTLGDVPTPKDQSMKAFINKELAEEKSYYGELDTLIEIAKNRSILITSILKSLGDERFTI